MRKTTTVLTATALLATVALTATGCASLEDMLRSEEAATYDTIDDFRDEAVISATWLPEDSHDISLRRSTKASDAAIALSSTQPLNVAMCAPVTRQSAPAYNVDDSVDVYKITDAFACGDWTVVRTDAGWLGWTPSHPDEKAQSPS